MFQASQMRGAEARLGGTSPDTPWRARPPGPTCPRSSHHQGNWAVPWGPARGSREAA